MRLAIVVLLATLVLLFGFQGDQIVTLRIVVPEATTEEQRKLYAAMAELRRCAGTQFDPALVEVFVAALAVSSTIVDVSPFSTNGALMLANKPDTIEEPVYYKQILTYGVLVTLVGPLLVWAALVLPGW